MDSLILQVVLLCIAVCFGPSQSQGRHVFQPRIRKVSMTEHFHHLLLEWDAQGDSKEYRADPEIVFNIQVNQTEENRIVLDTNYTVSLSELRQPLEWSWDPLVPLQCEPHVVRIRSLVKNKSFPHSEMWSDWSPWEAVAGLDTLDDNKNYIFPKKSIVKAGSNFAFCCVAKKTEIVRGFNADRDNHFTDKRQRKVLFRLEDMHSARVVCLTSDERNPYTESYVIELPHKPNNFSCEIEDRLKLRCSWKTNEKKHPYYYPIGVCETELILSNVNYTETYCSQTLTEEHSCSFPIRETRIPKLRLTARNCFGGSHTEYDFYENHKAPSGQLDIWRDIRPGLDKRNVTIFWKRSLDFRDNGNVTYEIRWEKVDDPTVSESRSLLPEFNSTTVFLDYDSYKISVSAKNVVNSSSPSVMIISRTAGKEKVQETKDGKIKDTSEGISVSWQPQARFDGYVVDWCSYPQSHLSDFQWEKFGGNYSSAVIKSDAFRFNVTYIFRVYGSLNNMTDLLEKALYLKEYGEEDPNESSTPVGTPGSYIHNSDFLFGNLLVLMNVPIMLIMCVCFWKSSCIRKRCFPTIPRPDISPFLKLNLETMKICDVAPDKLEVMENRQISKGKQFGLGMIIIENITYVDPTYDLNLQEQEAESNKLNPPLTSYKPLQDVLPVNSLPTSYKPLQDFFCKQTHQPYISLE